MHRFTVDTSKLRRPEFQTRTSHQSLTVGRFVFNSDGTVAGDNAVNEMAAVAEQDYQTLKAIYGLGDIPNQPIVVTVDQRAGGAYHQTCADTGIHLIPEDAPSLLVAELDECFQALQGKMDCGLGVGEGHSRAMAHVVRPFKVLTGLDGDVTGWWNNGNPTDYLNDGTQSDTDERSNACNTLGWFWLKSLTLSGHPATWPIVTAAASMKLGDTFTALTGNPESLMFTGMVTELKGIAQPWPDNPFETVTPLPLPTPTPVQQGPGCLATPFLFIYGLWRTIFG